jgi:hypothetical protein
MVRKIVLGLFEGASLGALVFFALFGLHVVWSALVTYAAAGVVGALVGAVAGKPIWGREAKLEALLKSLAGAFIAAVAMYGARKWLSGFDVNLQSLGLGAGPIGEVPSAALPLIGAGLGFVFQIDDALGSDADPPRRRVADAAARAEEDLQDEDESSQHRARRGQ